MIGFESVEDVRERADAHRLLLQAQDAERRHIARELHASAGQTLTVLGLKLAQLALSAHAASDRFSADQFSANLRDAQELVRRLACDLRTTSYLLHPPLLDELGLVAALRWYAVGLTERGALDVDLRIGEGVGPMGSELELTIFRVVQEALMNVYRHSGSCRAAVDLRRQGDQVQVQIEDHGRGIPAERLLQIRSWRSGVGIAGMRERVRRLNGRFLIESDSRGTRVTVSFCAAGGST